MYTLANKHWDCIYPPPTHTHTRVYVCLSVCRYSLLDIHRHIYIYIYIYYNQFIQFYIHFAQTRISLPITSFTFILHRPEFVSSQSHLIGSFVRVFSIPTVWLTLLVLVVIALIPDLIFDIITATRLQRETDERQLQTVSTAPSCCIFVSDHARAKWNSWLKSEVQALRCNV